MGSSNSVKHLSHAELVNSIRKGAMYSPSQPGLLEAAREVLRPMIENLKGREILFDEHVLELARVEYVEVTDEGFHIAATRIKYIDTNRGLSTAFGKEIARSGNAYMYLKKVYGKSGGHHVSD